jgi:hypothetical protein
LLAPHQILSGVVCNQIAELQDFGAGVFYFLTVRVVYPYKYKPNNGRYDNNQSDYHRNKTKLVFVFANHTSNYATGLFFCKQLLAKEAFFRVRIF